MFEFITVRELYEMFLSNQMMDLEGYEYVELEGWVRTNRNNGKLGFIALNDGTYFKNLQVVYTEAEISNYEEIDKLSTGSSIRVVGKLKLTPEGKQPFEVEATEIEIEGKCDEDFPLQKKRHSFEYMREIPHLRPRANTFYAIFRLRSVLSMAIHEFFQSQGFVYVHTPIITGNDGEGAGEMFRATTIDGTNFEDDFFEKEAFLTVTGQLHVEAFAMAFRDVYTFGPAFRAENSNTSRHASEFWMIEPEIAFADLQDVMLLAQDLIKFIISFVMETCPDDLAFFNQFVDKGLLERLNHIVTSEFACISYTNAIEQLQNCGAEFEYPVAWGIDLQTEHERYLTEQIFKKPVFVTDYPKEIKAFYMRLNDDGKTVAAMDLLVPGIGEIIGGSQREERLDLLRTRMQEAGLKEEDYWWYLDLRRFGGTKHAGFGLGFERMVMYLTGISNIRDVLPFPRTTGNAEF